MAVVQYSALVTQLRGKLGGSQFNKGHAGYTLQRKSTPTIRHTPAQLAQRQRVATAQRLWKTESDIRQQEAAQAAASNPTADRFGQQVVLSGYNQYIKIQTRRLLASSNQSPLPLDRPFITVPVLGGKVEVSNVVIDLDTGYGGNGYRLLFSLERLVVSPATGGSAANRVYYYIRKCDATGRPLPRTHWVYLTRNSFNTATQSPYEITIGLSQPINVGDYLLLRADTWNIDAGAHTGSQTQTVQVTEWQL